MASWWTGIKYWYRIGRQSDAVHWIESCSRMVAARARGGAFHKVYYRKRPKHLELCDECWAKQKRIDAAATKV